MDTADPHYRRDLGDNLTLRWSTAEDTEPGQLLQLLFGYRSLEELRDTYADVIADDESIRLLETLFPKRLSRPLLVN